MSAEKQALLDEVKEKINLKDGFILASYDKLSANAISRMRISLAAAGGDMFVVKKRVFAKAAAEKNVLFSLDELQGHVLVALAKGNFLAVAKEMYKVKDETNALKILGGYFEDAKCDSSEVQQISSLPSLDEMRAQFIGLLEAPMSQNLATMEAFIASVMDCVENNNSNET
jgi:large subunit ribosomal protein L10